MMDERYALGLWCAILPIAPLAKFSFAGHVPSQTVATIIMKIEPIG